MVDFELKITFRGEASSTIRSSLPIAKFWEKFGDIVRKAEQNANRVKANTARTSQSRSSAPCNAKSTEYCSKETTSQSSRSEGCQRSVNRAQYITQKSAAPRPSQPVAAGPVAAAYMPPRARRPRAKRPRAPSITDSCPTAPKRLQVSPESQRSHTPVAATASKFTPCTSASSRRNVSISQSSTSTPCANVGAIPSAKKSRVFVKRPSTSPRVSTSAEQHPPKRAPSILICPKNLMVKKSKANPRKEAPHRRRCSNTSSPTAMVHPSSSPPHEFGIKNATSTECGEMENCSNSGQSKHPPTVIIPPSDSPLSAESAKTPQSATSSPGSFIRDKYLAIAAAVLNDRTDVDHAFAATKATSMSTSSPSSPLPRPTPSSSPASISNNIVASFGQSQHKGTQSTMPTCEIPTTNTMSLISRQSLGTSTIPSRSSSPNRNSTTSKSHMSGLASLPKPSASLPTSFAEHVTVSQEACHTASVPTLPLSSAMSRSVAPDADHPMTSVSRVLEGHCASSNTMRFEVPPGSRIPNGADSGSKFLPSQIPEAVGIDTLRVQNGSGLSLAEMTLGLDRDDDGSDNGSGTDTTATAEHVAADDSDATSTSSSSSSAAESMMAPDVASATEAGESLATKRSSHIAGHSEAPLPSAVSSSSSFGGPHRATVADMKSDVDIGVAPPPGSSSSCVGASRADHSDTTRDMMINIVPMQIDSNGHAEVTCDPALSNEPRQVSDPPTPMPSHVAMLDSSLQSHAQATDAALLSSECSHAFGVDHSYVSSAHNHSQVDNNAMEIDSHSENSRVSSENALESFNPFCADELCALSDANGSPPERTDSVMSPANVAETSAPSATSGILMQSSSRINRASSPGFVPVSSQAVGISVSSNAAHQGSNDTHEPISSNVSESEHRSEDPVLRHLRAESKTNSNNGIKMVAPRTTSYLGQNSQYTYQKRAFD